MPERKEEVVLIVNAQPKKWNEDRISYNQVVYLAYPIPPGPNVTYTITYGRGPPDNKQGTLTEGNSVFVKSGMAFDVTPTNRS